MQILEPLYRTLRHEDSFELREYEDLLVAKVLVDGPFENAYRLGSDILREYLAGENYKQQKMEVKTPFMLTARPDGWEVSCILPSHLNFHSIPRPIGDQIKFEEIMPRKVAVVKFQGKAAYPAMMRKTEELKFWVKSSDLSFGDSSRIVVYQNSRIPFMRKNEIHLDGVQ